MQLRFGERLSIQFKPVGADTPDMETLNRLRDWNDVHPASELQAQLLDKLDARGIRADSYIGGHEILINGRKEASVDRQAQRLADARLEAAAEPENSPSEMIKGNTGTLAWALAAAKINSQAGSTGMTRQGLEAAKKQAGVLQELQSLLKRLGPSFALSSVFVETLRGFGHGGQTVEEAVETDACDIVRQENDTHPLISPEPEPLLVEYELDYKTADGRQTFKIANFDTVAEKVKTYQ